jgi:hypothetical protein
MFRCPLPPCITRLGFDCAGAGFAIGGQSALFTTTVPWRQPTRHLGGSLVRQVDSQLVAPRQRHMSLERARRLGLRRVLRLDSLPCGTRTSGNS